MHKYNSNLIPQRKKVQSTPMSYEYPGPHFTPLSKDCDEETYRGVLVQYLTDEEFEKYPMLYQYVEKGNKKLIGARLEFVEKLSAEEIVPYLENGFKLERTYEGNIRKVSPTDEVLNILSVNLHILTKQFYETGTFPKSLKVLWRCTRNAAANSTSQMYMVRSTQLFEDITTLSEIVLSRENCARYLKVPIQALINLVSSGEEIAKIVYQKCHKIIKKCLLKNYCTYECLSLLYNVSRYDDILNMDICKEFLKHFLTDQDNEYVHFYFDKSLSSQQFWTAYQSFKIEDKLNVLNFVSSKFIDHINIVIDISCIEILSKEFIDSVGDVIFQMNQDCQDVQVQFVSLLLQILSLMSANEDFLSVLQENTDLFLNVGVVLINIHTLGKTAGSFFAPIKKLAEAKTSKLKEHQAFEFKVDLIKIIGNMCWKSSKMQNLARTAELIPVVLDCCNMDAKNPFIIQWCVFAIRNICDQNYENQKYISGLHKKGFVKSAALKEMGITLNIDPKNPLTIIDLENLKLQ